MPEMQSDEQVYAELTEHPISEDDLKKMRAVILKWQKAIESSRDASLRIVFLSCIQIIGTMGPAYCRVAAATLMDRAERMSAEKLDS